MERAKQLIKLAKICDADYVKFQKRNPDESTPEHIKNKPHPNTAYAYGSTYLEHRKNLELTLDQHRELRDYCQDLGIGYSSSVWDLTSAHEIISLQPDFIKVGSPSNNNHELISCLYDEYSGDVHISLGMSSREEIDELVMGVILPKLMAPERTVLYHCTSEYPCPFDRLYILDISYLMEKYQSYGFEIGFSNHGYGLAADIAAWVLGARWIERHFIDDRTIQHSDASASLEPDGLRRLCRDLNHAWSAMAMKPGITPGELEQRKKLRHDPLISN
jgi:N-acetylneuraminate synthase